jgi:hypothetical protein
MFVEFVSQPRHDIQSQCWGCCVAVATGIIVDVIGSPMLKIDSHARGYGYLNHWAQYLPTYAC